jgi:hypothetical protein
MTEMDKPRMCGKPDCWTCNGPFQCATDEPNKHVIHKSCVRAAREACLSNEKFSNLLSQARCGSVWETETEPEAVSAETKALYAVSRQFLDVLEQKGEGISGQISSFIIALACAVDAMNLRECLKPGCSICSDVHPPEIRGEHIDACWVLIDTNPAFKALLENATCETMQDLNFEKLGVITAFLQELAIEASKRGVNPAFGDFGAVLVFLACSCFGPRY